MIPLALPDDAASMYAYTPPALVAHEASASTSGPNDRIPHDRIPPRLALGAILSLASEAGLVNIAPYATCNAVYATRDFVDMIDPLDELVREICKKAYATWQAKAAYRERIAELISDAALDDISLNKASEQDFWTFLKAQAFFCKGKLFLLDNRNLRAVWKNETGDQIGLQFLGNGTIQYVNFKHRPRAEDVSRVAGRDTLDGTRRQIAALDLNNLMAA